MSKPSSTDIQNTIASLQSGYSNDRDLVNQLLGQVQMAGAFEDFSRTVRTSKLKFIKENKLYKELSGIKSPNGSELSGSWSEFCSLLGISVDKADLDISNLNSFGEEALESMTRMGIGYRELRQFRKLPDDQKNALIEAAKTEDKDSLLELAEEMMAKQAQEKEALKKQLAEREAELDASRQLSADKEKKHDKLFYEKARLEEQLQKRIKTELPDAVGAALRTETHQIAYGAEAILRGALVTAFEALSEHTEQSGITHDDFMSGVLGQLQHAINQLRGQFDVKEQADGETVDVSWLNNEENGE